MTSSRSPLIVTSLEPSLETVRSNAGSRFPGSSVTSIVPKRAPSVTDSLPLSGFATGPALMSTSVIGSTSGAGGSLTVPSENVNVSSSLTFFAVGATMTGASLTGSIVIVKVSADWPLSTRGLSAGKFPPSSASIVNSTSPYACSAPMYSTWPSCALICASVPVTSSVSVAPWSRTPSRVPSRVPGSISAGLKGSAGSKATDFTVRVTVISAFGSFCVKSGSVIVIGGIGRAKSSLTERFVGLPDSEMPGASLTAFTVMATVAVPSSGGPGVFPKSLAVMVSVSLFNRLFWPIVNGSRS